MNGNSGAMSPVSVDGSDWSGINQYQKSDAPFSPTFPSRGNLATPPTSGVSSIPLSPSSTGLPLPGSRPGSANPSPPSSVGGARSSSGTLGDEPRDGGRRRRQMEEILNQHYVTLKRFLSATYREDRINGRSNKARDKLLRLSPTQFHELSTDVYDELIRRQQTTPAPGRPPRPDAPAFLPPRSTFHEKRNHARQKLASLQHTRFRDLATDVFCELERRFPHFTGRRPSPGLPPDPRRSQSRGPPSRMGRGYPSGGPASPYGPPRQASLGGPPQGMNGEGPFPRSFQSNTMVPNKSTMVEDSDDMGPDDDDDARSDAFALDAVLSRRATTTTLGEGERKLLVDSQAQVSALQEKVEKLEELVRCKDEELSRSQDSDQSAVSLSERQEWDDLRQDLESKVSQAEDLNNSLQLELDRVRAEHESVERDLRHQLDEVARESGDSDLVARYAELETKHQSLQSELQQQQELTTEVRRETSEFLMEMKTLTAQSHANWEQEERMSIDVQRLENEVKEWKHRYAKAKAQQGHLRTSSGGLSDIRTDASAVVKEHELVQPNGVVKDIHVTKFQMSIDELLRSARFEDAQVVSDQVKAVIVAVRCMIQDVDQAPLPVDGSANLRTKAKTRVSATANNMITAARNFTGSSGLSPVSLLDAAASHLSTAVVELIRVVKIQASPADELEDVDVDLSQEKYPDYFGTTASQRPYSNHSEYSAISPPDQDHPAMQNGYTNGFSYAPQEDHELQELKLYVEDQTDGMVQSIQALVASIRAEQELSSVEIHVSAIGDVVTNVVSATENLIHDRSGDIALREQSEPAIKSLDECRGRLMNTVAEGHNATTPEQVREVTNQLPPLAFEIARQTKELVQRLDSLTHGDDDDFR
ncbi:Spa2 homology (SHD) of GIT [Penicillium odoratum]|uniref:Spa2 homology (SHD) of GIT n=1 Tax=Penicillium odoratum TaxID=1167516 RepID=UPI002546F3E7|nr:Spa2 homology (SHD) of GIT [Penicillium odoratum]KAJ5751787.1 Spa2 homology (SHD) of GIT [Penicillium odoratum]